MTLLHPFALLYLALLPLLVLAWVLREPRRVLRVSSLSLWEKLRPPDRRRLAVRARRSSWLLAVQLLFFALLVVALAEPILPGFGSAGRRIILIFDASASMNALEAGTSRFDLARERALDLVRELDGHDEVQIVVARNVPETVTGFVSDRRRIRAVIEGLSASHARGDLEAAVETAVAAAGDAVDEIVVFGDGASDGLPAADERLPRVRFVQVGKSSDNVAITQLALRTDARSPLDEDVFAEVVNFSDRERAVPFVLSADEVILLAETPVLQPGERRGFSVSASLRHEALIQAKIELTDALALDNRAHAIAGGPGPTSVLLVTDGNTFLRGALEADPLCEVTVVRPDMFRNGSEWANTEVIVLDGAEIPRPERGRLLVIERPRRPGSTQSRLRVIDPKHPLTRAIGLDGIAIGRPVGLAVPADATVLLEAEGQPVGVAVVRPGLRRLTLGFDVRQSELPVSIAFPIFVSRAIRWLASPGRSDRDELLAGQTLDWQVPESGPLSEMRIAGPGGVFTRRPREGRLQFDRTWLSGVYTVTGKGFERRFVVNGPGESESDITPRGVANSSDSPMSSVRGPRPGGFELSGYVAGCALALLLLEWLLYCGRLGHGRHSGGRTDPA